MKPSCPSRFLQLALSSHAVGAMNGALTQPSPPRRQQNSRAGGAQTPQASLDGQNAAVKRIRPRTRGSRSGGRPRRYPGKLPGSKLASVTPLTSADVSASEDASSGSSDADNLAGDSAEESDFARQQRFQNVDTGNQYEQVRPLTSTSWIKAYIPTAQDQARRREEGCHCKGSDRRSK